jgi:hypothetical protein
VPTDVEVLEPIELRVEDLHLGHRITRDVEQLHRRARDLDGQRQQVVAAAGAVPAEGTAAVGEVHVARIADDAAVGLPVPGIADELFVPDARSDTVRVGWWEQRQGGPNAPPIGGEPQMVDTGLGDALRCRRIAPVTDDQAAPVEAADAPRAVAPRDAGAHRGLVIGL